MRGTIHNQVEGLYHCISKGIKISRHEIKRANAKDRLIHSDNTRTTYLHVWHSIAQYAKDKHDVSDITELTGEIVRKWLERQIAAGIAPGTIRVYLAAISKLQVALEDYQTKFGGRK